MIWLAVFITKAAKCRGFSGIRLSCTAGSGVVPQQATPCGYEIDGIPTGNIGFVGYRSARRLMEGVADRPEAAPDHPPELAMRIEQLEYLAAVTRYGSLRRASDQLHVSQPAISEAIRKLERELGV